MEHESVDHEFRKARRTPHGGSNARELQLRTEAALAPLGLHGVSVERRGFRVHLVGSVHTQRQFDLVREVLRQVEGAEQVVNELAVEPPYEGMFPAEWERSGQATDFTMLESEAEGLEPDFTTHDVGAEEVMEAVSEAEPYFPPTDIVEKSSDRTREGLEVIGGFGSTSLEGPTESEDQPAHVQRGDDEITEGVMRSLQMDSGTTDLPIHVRVRRGIVHLYGRVGSMEDIDLAEEVASRVPGVVEIREDLEVEGMA